MKFINWVRQTFPKKERANLRAIPGGNFTVPKEGLECFLDGFCKKRRKWKEGDDGTTWVWVPPQVDSLPLCVDIDLRYDTEREQPLELFSPLSASTFSTLSTLSLPSKAIANFSTLVFPTPVTFEKIMTLLPIFRLWNWIFFAK